MLCGGSLVARSVLGSATRALAGGVNTAQHCRSAWRVTECRLAIGEPNRQVPPEAMDGQAVEDQIDALVVAVEPAL